MSETTTNKKVVSFEARVDNIESSAVEYATNEEVLALFQETQPAQDQPTQEAE